MIILAFGIMIFQKGSLAVECPCDIYAKGQATCAAAYSTVRLLSSMYKGALYQVRRTSDKQTKDIFPLTGDVFANAATQDSFLGTGAGTISKIYDQSGKGNDLIKAPKGCYTGTASQDDYESDAKGRSLMVNGHKVYALYTKAHDGYRNNTSTGMPTNLAGQGIYMVADGKRYGGACCFDFGNASKDNCYGTTGIMTALFFGTGSWGKGTGSGPWFMADLEGGVWAGGSGGSGVNNSKLPSSNVDYAFGILKHSSTSSESQYAIKAGNAQSGNLTTAYDGKAPKVLKIQGGIILGIGGDNSNSSYGTFFEGVITNGRPADATDDEILKNVQDAKYGSTVVSTIFRTGHMGSEISQFEINYNQSNASAVINYTLQDSRNMSMKIFNQQGKLIMTLIDKVVTAGKHETIWDAKHVRAGVYVAQVLIDGHSGWAGKIVKGE
jgi:non-reducing end alpha-L-arabinofuranosidase